MWQTTDEKLPDVETANNNNLCTKSLLHNLMESQRSGNASSNSLDQQSNSSSLESIESPALDGNQALSTSCSEDSFEMSSTTSKPAADDALKLSFRGLNLASFSESGIPAQLSKIATDSLEQRTSECGSSEMSRDSLEPCSSFEKTDSLMKTDSVEKTNSLTSASCRFDDFNRRNNVPEQSIRTEVLKMGTVDAEASESWPVRHGSPSTSKSTNSIAKSDNGRRNRASLREYIDKELNNLDTCLPKLDFNKLEEKLNCAAKERMMTERKLLGEQVRRRLALQVDQYTAEPAPRVYTRPSRSNLGFRLQTAMNLQVCYINDLNDEEEEEEDSSDDDLFVPKSKSAPNLQYSVFDGSTLNATQLRQAVSSLKGKRQVLEEETKLMLAKAKQAAKMQMEIEKLNADRFATAVPPKASRLQLSRMTCRQLIQISEQLSKRIDEENAELMKLLVEKDSLHMQQDSMLVDIEDMIQHESNSESLNLPDFLKIQATSPMATSKFRILKR